MTGWIEAEDLKAFYIYKYQVEHIPYDMVEIAKKINRTVSALKMRIDNFKFEDTSRGLSKSSQQTKRVYQKYKDKSELELRKLAFPELFDD